MHHSPNVMGYIFDCEINIHNVVWEKNHETNPVSILPHLQTTQSAGVSQMVLGDFNTKA